MVTDKEIMIFSCIFAHSETLMEKWEENGSWYHNPHFCNCSCPWYLYFFFYPFCVPIAYKKHLFLKLYSAGLEVLVPAKYSFKKGKVIFFLSYN